MTRVRPASSIDDLVAAEAVLTRAWLDAAPFAASHAGDLEWWHALAAPDEIGGHLHLWEDGDGIAAWSWLRADQVFWEVWAGPGRHAADGRVLEAILAAAIEGTSETLHAWAPEDDVATIAVLERLGFRPGDRRLSQFQTSFDQPPPTSPVPPGYRIRCVSGAGEIAARVEAHAAAFGTARLTTDKYERLVTLPHYRFEDDLVVEAPDGSIAAFAMAWWDPVARIGEYEPVGTHPDHRRKGLGRALLSHGLARYRELGARLVQVYSVTDNAGSEGLYPAVGFRRRRYRRLFERPVDRP